MNRSTGLHSDNGVTQSLVDGVVTRTQMQPSRIHWRFCESGHPAFDPDVFDHQRLAARNQIAGIASAGRGNTHFISVDGQELVLRHYRRGGLAQHLSKDRYLFTGLERTRAMREFTVLLELKKRALRAPQPYACRVVVHGASYSASLVTYKLPGHTMAECIEKNTLDLAQWQSIGDTIGQFHSEGLFHADLNTHNVMIDNYGCVALIDFDRAGFRSGKLSKPLGGWRRQNIDRLERSLKKVANYPEDGFKALVNSWKMRLCE